MFRSLANVVLLTSSIVCAGAALSCFGCDALPLLDFEHVVEAVGTERIAVVFNGALGTGIAACIGAVLSAVGLWFQARSYRLARRNRDIQQSQRCSS
jgi:hypothetical protein